MAQIRDTDSVQATLGARFLCRDKQEADSILIDLQQIVLDRLEYHGFHPDGVRVDREAW